MEKMAVFDIDDTLVYWDDGIAERPIPAGIEKLNELKSQGFVIAYCTAKPESERENALRVLTSLGLPDNSEMLFMIPETGMNVPRFKRDTIKGLMENYDVQHFYDDKKINRTVVSNIGVPIVEAIPLGNDYEYQEYFSPGDDEVFRRNPSQGLKEAIHDSIDSLINEIDNGNYERIWSAYDIYNDDLMDPLPFSHAYPRYGRTDKYANWSGGKVELDRIKQEHIEEAKQTLLNLKKIYPAHIDAINATEENGTIMIYRGRLKIKEIHIEYIDEFAHLSGTTEAYNFDPRTDKYLEWQQKNDPYGEIGNLLSSKIGKMSIASLHEDEVAGPGRSWTLNKQIADGISYIFWNGWLDRNFDYNEYVETISERIEFSRIDWAMTAIMHYAKEDEVFWSIPKKNPSKNGWKITKKHGERIFEFSDFEQVADFISELNKAIIDVDHHPEIEFDYNKVKVKTWSHDTNSFTDRDEKLIKAINKIKVKGLVSNPAPGYQSYAWTTQDWRSIKVNNKGGVNYSEQCGGKGTRTKTDKPRLCLPVKVIKRLMRTDVGKKVLFTQARQKARAKKGERVSWHPMIKKLHNELEKETVKDIPKRNPKPISVRIEESSNPGNKMMATFEYKDGKTKTTHFGARGMSDYTQHKDEKRMKLYLKRHGGVSKTKSSKEYWDDPTTAGALSRWILWGKPSLRESFNDFKKRFNLKGTMTVSNTAEIRRNARAMKVRHGGQTKWGWLPTLVNESMMRAKQKGEDYWSEERLGYPEANRTELSWYDEGDWTATIIDNPLGYEKKYELSIWPAKRSKNMTASAYRKWLTKEELNSGIWLGKAHSKHAMSMGRWLPLKEIAGKKETWPIGLDEIRRNARAMKVRHDGQTNWDWLPPPLKEIFNRSNDKEFTYDSKIDKDDSKIEMVWFDKEGLNIVARNFKEEYGRWGEHSIELAQGGKMSLAKWKPILGDDFSKYWTLRRNWKNLRPRTPYWDLDDLGGGTQITTMTMKPEIRRNARSTKVRHEKINWYDGLKSALEDTIESKTRDGWKEWWKMSPPDFPNVAVMFRSYDEEQFTIRYSGYSNPRNFETDSIWMVAFTDKIGFDDTSWNKVVKGLPNVRSVEKPKRAFGSISGEYVVIGQGGFSRQDFIDGLREMDLCTEMDYNDPKNWARRNARAMKVRHKVNWWEEVEWKPIHRTNIPRSMRRTADDLARMTTTAAARIPTCDICGQEANPHLSNMETPIGSRSFCTEKEYTEYVGLEYKGEGYYTKSNRISYDMIGHIPFNNPLALGELNAPIVILNPTYRPKVKMLVHDAAISWAQHHGFTLESNFRGIVYELKEPPMQMINYIRELVPKNHDELGFVDPPDLERNARGIKIRHKEGKYWDSAVNPDTMEEGSVHVQESNGSVHFLIDITGRTPGHIDTLAKAYWVRFEPEFAAMQEWFGGEATNDNNIMIITAAYKGKDGVWRRIDDRNWNQVGRKVTGNEWVELQEKWAESNDPLKNDLASEMKVIIDERKPNVQLWRKWQVFNTRKQIEGRLKRMVELALNPTTRNPNLKEALETLDNKKDWPPDVDWTDVEEVDVWDVDWNPALKVLKVVADLGLDKYINMPHDKAIAEIEKKFKDDPSKKAKAIKALTKMNKGMRIVQDKGWDLLRASPIRNNPIREKKDEQGNYFQYGKQKKYYFDKKSTHSREAAYDRVKAQVAAIFASGYRPRKNARAMKVMHKQANDWWDELEWSRSGTKLRSHEMLDGFRFDFHWGYGRKNLPELIIATKADSQTRHKFISNWNNRYPDWPLENRSSLRDQRGVKKIVAVADRAFTDNKNWRSARNHIIYNEARNKLL